MESIIIEIVLGNTGQCVEFMLPAHVPISSLVQDIARLIEQVHLTVAFDKDAIALLDMEKGNLLCMEWTFAQNKVLDGSRLMIL